MKKYSFILCIALVAFVVASCGLKGNHTSSGRAYELLVVVDHGVWDRAAGRALHDALDADMPGLPQSEPSFRIMYTSPKDYDSTLKLTRIHYYQQFIRTATRGMIPFQSTRSNDQSY